jgi:hypothetical protein
MPTERAERAEPTTGHLSCFLNQDRICGADCMAHLPQAPEGPSYLGENWAHCLLLVDAERVGKHLVILVDLHKKVQANAQRSQKPPGVV